MCTVLLPPGVHPIAVNKCITCHIYHITRESYAVCSCWIKLMRNIRCLWTGIAQSVWRLATSRTVRGSNPGGGEIFRIGPERPYGPSSLLYNGYRGLFPGGKAAGACLWPHTPYSDEVKERVELYRYFPSGSSWPVLGWTLPFIKGCVLNNTPFNF
jgi:hypothetical protein